MFRYESTHSETCSKIGSVRSKPSCVGHKGSIEMRYQCQPWHGLFGFESPNPNDDTVPRSKDRGYAGQYMAWNVVPKYQVIQCSNMAWIDLTKVKHRISRCSIPRLSGMRPKGSIVCFKEHIHGAVQLNFSLLCL